MKTMKKFWMSSLILLAVVGCDDAQEIQNWVDHTNGLRVEAKAQSEIVPYGNPQFEALRDYFTEIANIALALKDDPKFALRFNAAIAKSDLGEICPKIFVPKSDWEVIVVRCIRNRYFLCAEEVKAYPDSLTLLKEQLTPELRNRFEKTEACQTAL